MSITPEELRAQANFWDGKPLRLIEVIRMAADEIERLQAEADAMDLARSEERTLRQNLIVENAQLREALEWYADGSNYAIASPAPDGMIIVDGGARARAALAGK